MLVPAILFKEQIITEFQRIYFTEDMMYLTGCLEQWSPDISASPEEGKFDFAIISNNKLIGRNSRGGTYSTYIKCKNNRTEEEGYQSFNMLGRLLENYEFEQLNRVEV